ncbi:MAG TPA: hypothetical protein VGM86_03665 [Thermoanaerobaculia bacterium]
MSGLFWIVAAVALLALIVWAQRRMPLLQYLYFWRFPIGIGLALVGVVPFSLIVAPSLLRSLFVLAPREILFVSWLATLASWVVEITIEVILRYAPLRFQVASFPVAPWIRHRRVALFSLLAWPMIGTAVALSSPPWGTSLLMALAGIVLAALSLLAAAVIRELLRHPDEPSPSLLLPMKPRWLDRLPTLRSPKPLPAAPVDTVLAHGYVDPATDRFRPGHLMGASFFAITAFLYALGFFLLRPDRGSSMPALGYGLLILMLAGWALPGISFFLDRYRVPVLLPLLALSWLSSQVFDTDHYYRLLVPQVRTAPGRAGVSAQISAQVLPSVSSGEAFRVAQEKNPEPGHPVVVVATTGGGITAALWTTRVLTSLQREIGPGFSRSIRLISAVSGGSVGTMYFLDRFTPRGPPAAADLDRIVAAAGAPSVDAAAWGLAYPDLWRVFFGFLVWPDKTLDRGWALERAWRSHLVSPDATLADWGRGTSAGWLPAAVLNATATETGEQFLLTPLGWDHPWKGRFFSTVYPTRDLHVSTAARLSATFPWVSPMARAQDVNGRPAAPGFHLADGGYFDNFGVVTVVNWLRSLPPEQWEELRRKGLLLVLVRAFPDRPESAGPRARQSQGWLWSALGPLLTMYNVRTSAQASTGDVEMELAQKVLACNGVNNLQVVFQLQRNSPLSWKLTAEEKRAILAEWNEGPNRKSLEDARKFFRP